MVLWNTCNMYVATSEGAEGEGREGLINRVSYDLVCSHVAWLIPVTVLLDITSLGKRNVTFGMLLLDRQKLASQWLHTIPVSRFNTANTSILQTWILTTLLVVGRVISRVTFQQI